MSCNQQKTVLRWLSIEKPSNSVGNGAMTQPAQVWLQSEGGMAECDTGPT